MNKPKRGFNEGKFAARSFGAEYQANPGSSRTDYLNDAAWYFGKEKISELNEEERKALYEEFAAGIKAEKEAQ